MIKYQEILTKWKALNFANADELDKHLNNFKVLFAYHSGKIENHQIRLHDTKEIFYSGEVLAFSGNPRTIFEQQNQKLCYNYLKTKIFQKEPLTLKLLKEVHQILTNVTYDEWQFFVNNERPGKLKKHDYVTGVNEVGSTAENVTSDLEGLIEEIQKVDNKDILKVAAYFHTKFQNIHPFADGNGRVGRTMTNYLLMINQHPPFIFYDDDKLEYYNALQAFDETEEIQPLYSFFMKEIKKTWGK